jgi:hypothetical protein
VANLDWRRNLLTWTEQFDNAAWTISRATILANNTADPLGGNTADRFTITAEAAGGAIASQAPAVSGVSSTGSAYLKAGDAQWAFLRLNTTEVVWFDLINGAVGTQTNATGTITAVGNGWYRCTISGTPTANAFGVCGVCFGNGSTSSGTMLNKFAYVWGAQLELGSTATEYQRITDVNTEVIQRFPSATLYQDTAGTTPVTTPGQSVALALDKSKGLVLGSELIVNGDFSSGTTGWTGAGSTLASVSGAVQITADGTGQARASQLVTLVVGRWYEARATIWRGTGSINVDLLVSGIASSANVSSTTPTEVVVRFQATQVNQNIRAGSNGTAVAGTTYFADNISVKELPGFHATQATAGSRPIYGIVPVGGRRNLLTASDDLGTTQWNTASNLTRTVGGGGTSSSGSAYTRLTATAGNTDHYLQSAGLALTTGQTYAISFEVQYVSHRWVGIAVFDGGYRNGVTFDLLNGAVGSNLGNFVSRTLTPLGSNRYRISGVYTAVSTGNAFFAIAMLDADKVFTTTTVSNLTATIVDAGRAQFEVGSTATAYQKVTTQYDVTEAGVSSLSYLAFDGVDDFLVTPTITPGIDKAQVFAGVRKLSDAAGAVAVELSAAVVSNAGAFAIFAPSSAAPNYLFRSRGSAAQVGADYTNAIVAAPITNVITGLGDISGDIATLRINGAQAAQSTTDQGTGNYLAYPLYIGRRGGTSNPFNGQIFSLIVRFGANLTADQITSTETWVNGKTRAY